MRKISMLILPLLAVVAIAGCNNEPYVSRSEPAPSRRTPPHQSATTTAQVAPAQQAPAQSGAQVAPARGSVAGRETESTAVATAPAQRQATAPMYSGGSTLGGYNGVRRSTTQPLPQGYSYIKEGEVVR